MSCCSRTRCLEGTALRLLQAGAWVVVDNSILALSFQQPLELGADISMTSATKFIGGHSDGTAGILSVKDAELAKQVYFFQVGCLLANVSLHLPWWVLGCFVVLSMSSDGEC